MIELVELLKAQVNEFDGSLRLDRRATEVFIKWVQHVSELDDEVKRLIKAYEEIKKLNKEQN